MKLAIFGATGGTGRQLIEQGLVAGHKMTDNTFLHKAPAIT